MNYTKVANHLYLVNTDFSEIYVEFSGPENELINYVQTNILMFGKNDVKYTSDQLEAKYKTPPSNNEVEI